MGRKPREKTHIADLGRLAKPAAVPANPWLAEWQLPTEVKVSGTEVPRSCSEVLAVHLMEAGSAEGKRRLIAFWPGKEALEREQEVLAETFGLGEPSHTGPFRGLKDDRVAFWKQIRLSTWILGLASFLGGINALYDHFDTLFTAPNLALSLAEEPVNVISGESLGLKLTIDNGTATAHRNITTHAELSGAEGPPLSLEVHPALRPRLEAGDTHEPKISGTAPQPGRYEILVETSADAGWLRGWLGAPSFSTARELRIWPKGPVSHARFVRWIEGFAEFHGSSEHSLAAPEGLECSLSLGEVSIIGQPSVFARTGSEILQTDGVALFPRLHGPPKKQPYSVRWELRSQPAFQDYEFQISLPTPSGIDWERVGNDVELACFRKNPREEVKE